MSKPVGESSSVYSYPEQRDSHSRVGIQYSTCTAVMLQLHCFSALAQLGYCIQKKQVTQEDEDWVEQQVVIIFAWVERST